MISSKQMLVSLFEKIFPGTDVSASNSEVMVRFDEPEKIGVSLESMHLFLAGEQLVEGLVINAIYNGVPVSFDHSLVNELELSESRFKLHDLTVDSAISLKKVIRQFYC
ncbi:hypothetical protein P7F88_09750 [Vibrio hannami]|uniref:hypothetical protein n=1 Tax=Vibrio hannami TaxID=2717094 RepID=UPI00240F6848|nr:hypothetical protein [Vibrio hannami]MDG3086375.1 hypothetical protein [Vibrio hannami]